jgi:hypothetical protein
VENIDFYSFYISATLHGTTSNLFSAAVYKTASIGYIISILFCRVVFGLLT